MQLSTPPQPQLQLPAIKKLQNYITMKKIIKLMLCMTIMSFPFFGLAQHFEPWNSDMDINGIFLGSKYTKTQVTAKWGTPTKYSSNESEFGVNETYHYSTNRFEFSDNGIFGDFFIDTPKFVVYKSKNGGFKVGDPLSKVKDTGLFYRKSVFLEGEEKYIEIQGIDDWFKIGYSDDDKITWISYTSSI
jgi:hypothetical protein